MNKVRAIDGAGDWIWGIGPGAYKLRAQALDQQIQCAILSFLGDCFYDVNFGINWWTLLGTSNQAALNLAVKAQILNVPGVTGINQLSAVYNSRSRRLALQYQVQTVYGQTANQFQFDLGAINA